MLASIAVLIGIVILFASIFANALMGTQIALLGIGFVLIGIYLQIRRIASKS